MKKRVKIIGLIFLLIAVIITMAIILTKPNTVTETISNVTCTSDSDCVPAQCCHASSCINNNYKGVCNLLCTDVCSGPLDCNAGSCGCVNGKCSVIIYK
jgi:hypothetical protein